MACSMRSTATATSALSCVQCGGRSKRLPERAPSPRTSAGSRGQERPPQREDVQEQLTALLVQPSRQSFAPAMPGLNLKLCAQCSSAQLAVTQVGSCSSLSAPTIRPPLRGVA
jgi:hypothetical protein